MIKKTLKLKTIGIEPQTNIKPEAWYYEYCEFPEEKDLDNEVLSCMKYDNLVDVCKVIDKHLAPFHKQYIEADSIRRNRENITIIEFKKAKEQCEEAFNSFYSDIPLGVSEEEFDYYHQLIRGKMGQDYKRILDYNSLELNDKFLEVLIAHHNILKRKRAYIQYFALRDCKEMFELREKQFKLCKQALENSFLITRQLVELSTDIDECYYCFSSPKKDYFQNFFNDFSYTDEQIFGLIRKNENWHDIERDIIIFQEKQKGKYLQELADNYGIKFNSIRMVLKKVRSAFNYYKGKLFEDFIEKRLKQSVLFKKIVKEAGKGEPDILAYHKDGKYLSIYSLKNIKIDRKPYWLTKEELNPELERANLQSKDYKVNLILLVFDNHNNKIKQFKIDYRNPVNIDISK